MRNRHTRGVTFLEIMVVIVIIGIMAALVLPNLSGPRSKMALKSGAREIAAAGMYARQRAIVQGEPTYMIFTGEEDQWYIFVTPPEDDDERYERAGGDFEPEPKQSEEQLRKIPDRVKIERIEKDYEEMNLDDETWLTFYPNGTCTGLAVQLKNNRDKSLTIDFDQASGMPTVYPGQPKSLAAKLKENGLNPSDYGIIDDTALQDEGSRPGEGYYLSAGWNEEERVDYYKDAVDRMLERAQVRQRVEEEGVGVYYSEAARWGN